MDRQIKIRRFEIRIAGASGDGYLRGNRIGCLRIDGNGGRRIVESISRYSVRDRIGNLARGFEIRVVKNAKSAYIRDANIEIQIAVVGFLDVFEIRVLVVY